MVGAVEKRYGLILIALIVSIIAAVLAFPPNIPLSRICKRMEGSYCAAFDLSSSVKLLKERLSDIYSCVKEKRCDLYGFSVIIIAKPLNNDSYDVDIYIDDSLNYTRGSNYRDTVIRGGVMSDLQHHINVMSYGIATGYREWIDIEKRFGIHLNVGYGVYCSSGETFRLWIHVELPTFHYCNNVCGEFYLNATFYMDEEKYVVYQLQKIDYRYLINMRYLSVLERSENHVFVANPPAILGFADAYALSSRIPVDSINRSEGPVIITLNFVTTNRSVLDKYLNDLYLIKPLIEAHLEIPYMGELSWSPNGKYNVTKFETLLHKTFLRAARKFVETLITALRELYPNETITFTHTSIPSGNEYYLIRLGRSLLAVDLYVGTLDTHLHGVPSKLIRMIIDMISKTLPQRVAPH